MLDPKDPLGAAREILAALWTDESGTRLLHHYKGEFVQWRSPAYRPVDVNEMNSVVWKFLAKARMPAEGGALKPCRPNKHIVSNVVEGLKAISTLSSDVASPVWLDGGESRPLANELIPMANGLLHWPTRRLHPPDPMYLTFNASPVKFDRKAKPIEWLKFLKSLKLSQGTVRLLQEIMGLQLTTETKYQKIFLMVGPKRSGKGTIADVCQDLVGSGNWTNPTLAGLGYNFSLAQLIDKQLAAIRDARLGHWSDKKVVIERLLSISGGDSVTADRKHRTPWTGYLTARVVILTNELPSLPDASGALASRIVPLVLTESFFGKEDHGLRGRLKNENPGIFNWCLEGLRRLEKRGYFNIPKDSQEMIDDLEDLGSPVKCFVTERYDLGPNLWVTTAAIFGDFRTVCKSKGLFHLINESTLGRDLKAIYGQKIKKVRARINGKRVNIYKGIAPRMDHPDRLLWKKLGACSP